MGRIFHGRQCNVTPTNLVHCSRLPQSRCRRYWFSCGVKRRNTDSQCISLDRTTSKIARSRRGSQPLSNTWWAHPSPPPNGITIGSTVFAGFTNVTNLHKPRYSVCSNSYYRRSSVVHWMRTRCHVPNENR